MSREYNYTEEFKVQISKLRESGKPISAIVKESSQVLLFHELKKYPLIYYVKNK